MALVAVHFLANMIDHRFRGFHLSESQKAAAYKYLGTLNEDFLPIFMSHCIGEEPFPKYMYSTAFQKTRPITWWKSINPVNAREFEWQKLKFNSIKCCHQLLTAIESTAEINASFQRLDWFNQN